MTKKQTAIATRQETLPAEAATQHDPFALLERAIDKGTPVESLEKLVTLAERMADRKAAEAFHQALKAFQSACPPIPKKSVAKIAGGSGRDYSYRYAELDQIATIVNPILDEVGLSYSWDGKISDGMLTSTCTLRHVGGHSVSSSFSCPTGSRAGMSDQQKYAAANTYAMRYSLIQVLGLTTCDSDTDTGESQDTISEAQEADIRCLMEEVGADEKRFLKYLGVKQLQDLTVDRFKKAIAALESKRRQG